MSASFRTLGGSNVSNEYAYFTIKFNTNIKPLYPETCKTILRSQTLQKNDIIEDNSMFYSSQRGVWLLSAYCKISKFVAQSRDRRQSVS